MAMIMIVLLLMILLVRWMISTRRKLAVMDENVNNTLTQIGVQQSSCFNVLMMLLDLAKDYSAQEILALKENVKSRQSFLTAKFTSDEVQMRERMIAEAMDRIAGVAAQFPEFREHENYRKCMNAVDSYEKMLRTSCLIYNDSATKYNRAIQMAPASLIAGILGFHKREYLELTIGKTDMSVRR